MTGKIEQIAARIQIQATGNVITLVHIQLRTCALLCNSTMCNHAQDDNCQNVHFLEAKVLANQKNLHLRATTVILA